MGTQMAKRPEGRFQPRRELSAEYSTGACRKTEICPRDRQPQNIKLNDKVITAYIDKNNTYQSGRLALQQHNDSSVVQYRNVMVKRLPTDETAAWAEAKNDLPEIYFFARRKRKNPIYLRRKCTDAACGASSAHGRSMGASGARSLGATSLLDSR